MFNRVGGRGIHHLEANNETFAGGLSNIIVRSHANLPHQSIYALSLDDLALVAAAGARKCLASLSPKTQVTLHANRVGYDFLFAQGWRAGAGGPQSRI